MRNRGRMLATVVLVMAGLLLGGCGKSPAEKLVGKWRAVEGEKVIKNFKADGTFADADAKGDQTATGTWSITEAGKLKIEISMGDKTLDMELGMAFEGDDLVLEMPATGDGVMTTEAPDPDKPDAPPAPSEPVKTRYSRM
jgi:hypothetical protein